MELDFEARKFFVDLVCAMTTDPWTLKVAKMCTMSPHGRAAQNLDHYLEGKAGKRTLDLAALLREDRAVELRVRSVIAAELRRNVRSGRVPVQQHHFTNLDWQYALGAIVIDWSTVVPVGPLMFPISVDISFRNKYRWHPDEPRFTQSLHQAADRLKRRGACDFWMEGKTVIQVE